MNVYKKVAIIRRPTDSLTYEDADGQLKTVTDLGHAAATATPSAASKPKHDIPVPRILMVESYDKDVPSNYQIEKSYVRYHRPSQAEWNEAIEYVADAEDEAWLASNTRFGGACNNIPENEKKLKQHQQQTQAEIAAVGGGSDDFPTSVNAVTLPESTSAAALATPIKGNPVLTAAMTTPDTKTLQHQRRPQLSLNMFEHALDILEKETGFDIIVTISQAERLILARIPELSHLFPIRRPIHSSGGAAEAVPTISQVIQDIYNYWVQKRSKLKRPLLRRYWPVTSSDDTNPHLVFRPREKEKYKLRKKRQNDMDAYRKMKQLRNDFDNLRLLLDLTRRREELHRSLVRMQCELFEQQLFDLTDTSATPRLSSQIKKRDLDSLLAVPTYFDVSAAANKKGRRGRKSVVGTGGSRSVSPVPSHKSSADQAAVAGGSSGPDATPLVVAGQNFGEPAPNFLHPLDTREAYVTSWQHAVPHVTSYINAQPTPTYRFRHRPRVGRGGRLLIDRLPYPSRPDVAPRTVFTAGKGLPRRVAGHTRKGRLLDLLPEPLDHKAISRRIEDISVAALKDDLDRASGLQAPHIPGAPPPDPEEYDGDEVLVQVDDWLDTDEQLWGEERYAVGPI